MQAACKGTVYWPHLNDQLEKLVLSCELCLKYSKVKCKQQPTLPLGQEIPLHAWTKLATDIFFIWKELPTYILLIIPADFQLCSSFHQ